MNKRVMIADDDAAIVESMKILLQDEGYEVSTSAGPDTVAKIALHPPDIVLLDLWMSGVDGRDIATELKAHPATNHIPIIIVSANRDCESIAISVGANDFLPKPYDIDDLLDRLERQLSPV